MRNSQNLWAFTTKIRWYMIKSIKRQKLQDVLRSESDHKRMRIILLLIYYISKQLLNVAHSKTFHGKYATDWRKKTDPNPRRNVLVFLCWWQVWWCCRGSWTQRPSGAGRSPLLTWTLWRKQPSSSCWLIWIIKRTFRLSSTASWSDSTQSSTW